MKLSKEENRAWAFIAVMIALSVLGRWADRPLPLTTDLAAIDIDSLVAASAAAQPKPKSSKKAAARPVEDAFSPTAGPKAPKEPAARPSTGRASTGKASTGNASTAKASTGKAGKSSTANALPQPLDLNRATAAELEKVRGIGPVLAARIVAYRDSVGRFANVDALTGVRGVGPAMLERLRPYLRVP
jgi:competence protein ComEA